MDTSGHQGILCKKAAWEKLLDWSVFINALLVLHIIKKYNCYAVMFPYVQFYKMATNPKSKPWGAVYLYLSLQKYGSQTITTWKTNRKGNC